MPGAREVGEVVSFHGRDGCEHPAEIEKVNANGTMNVIKISTGSDCIVKPDQNGELVEVVDSALDRPQEPEPADAHDAEDAPSADAEAPVPAPAPNGQAAPASLLAAVSQDSEAGTLFPARGLIAALDLMSTLPSEEGPSADAEAPVPAPAPNGQVAPPSLLTAVSEDSEAGTLFLSRELVSALDLLSVLPSEEGPSDA